MAKKLIIKSKKEREEKVKKVKESNKPENALTSPDYKPQWLLEREEIIKELNQSHFKKLDTDDIIQNDDKNFLTNEWDRRTYKGQ